MLLSAHSDVTRTLAAERSARLLAEAEEHRCAHRPTLRWRPATFRQPTADRQQATHARLTSGASRRRRRWVVHGWWQPARWPGVAADQPAQLPRKPAVDQSEDDHVQLARTLILGLRWRPSRPGRHDRRRRGPHPRGPASGTALFGRWSSLPLPTTRSPPRSSPPAALSAGHQAIADVGAATRTGTHPAAQPRAGPGHGSAAASPHRPTGTSTPHQDYNRSASGRQPHPGRRSAAQFRSPRRPSCEAASFSSSS
jgi:hypothetical protein